MWVGPAMGVTYDQPTIHRISARLRKIIQESFQKHLYTTAIFYADKLFSLSPDVEDLYTLAECYFKNKEYHRVLHLLKKHGDIAGNDDRLKLLAAQSLMERKDWDECLRYIDENAVAEGSRDEKMASVFALLKGKVYELTENQENALIWYEKAVQLDPYCHEALDRLIGNHLLTLEKEVSLLRSLKLHEEDEWLRHMYAAKIAATNADSPMDPECGREREASQKPWCKGRHRRLKQATVGEAFANNEYPVPYLPSALVHNGQTLTAQSTRYFSEGDYESCYHTSKKVLDEDPFHLATWPVHIASLVMLDLKNAVFKSAHQLVNAYPTAAVSWFTAGCYYHMIKKYEHARRFFHKALVLDHTFAPTWIAYGHAFAQHDESDQALAQYRTASRLFPGSHLPWLFIGMEYVRTSSLQLAQQYLENSRTLMPADPHVYNELGVVAFFHKNYSKACDILLHALSLSSTPHETFCTNLGHAFLKCKVYDRALEYFQQAYRLSPNSSALSGIAFTLHCTGRIEEAIEYYHRALSMQHDDVFATEILKFAVQEAAEQPMSMEL